MTSPSSASSPGLDPPNQSRPNPLRYPAFRWLMAARTTNILGNAIAPVALAFAVLDLTGSATDLGLVVAARSISNVAVLIVGGVIADRLPRTVVLVGSSIAAALTQASIAALVLTGTATVWMLILLSIINGAVAAIGMPASAALIPQTVPTDLLRPANAILRLGLNTGGIVGAAGGAGIVGLVGPGWGIAIDAAGFALAAAFFAMIRVPLPKNDESDAERTNPPSPLDDLRNGWQEFSSRRWVWVVVLQFSVLNAAFVGATTVLGPVISDDTFGRAGWGVVVAAQTFGLASGAILALRWKPRRSLAFGVGLIVLTVIPVTTLAISPTLISLIIAFAIGGVSLELFTIAWDQSLQNHIPERALSRVYSYDMVGSFIAIPVGEIAVGPLAEHFGLDVTLFGCAALIVAATAAALLSKSVRGLHN